jgi:hypothetical protein
VRTGITVGEPPNRPPHNQRSHLARSRYYLATKPACMIDGLKIWHPGRAARPQSPGRSLLSGKIAAGETVVRVRGPGSGCRRKDTSRPSLPTIGPKPARCPTHTSLGGAVHALKSLEHSRGVVGVCSLQDDCRRRTQRATRRSTSIPSPASRRKRREASTVVVLADSSEWGG